MLYGVIWETANQHFRRTAASAFRVGTWKVKALFFRVMTVRTSTKILRVTYSQITQTKCSKSLIPKSKIKNNNIYRQSNICLEALCYKMKLPIFSFTFKSIRHIYLELNIAEQHGQWHGEVGLSPQRNMPIACLQAIQWENTLAKQLSIFLINTKS